MEQRVGFGAHNYLVSRIVETERTAAVGQLIEAVDRVLAILRRE